MTKIKNKIDVVDLLLESKMNNTYLKVCAPMVRYSKVHFRSLIRHYGIDLTFTPMIIADSFCQNSKARASEFSTTFNDSPLIVQFASNNAEDFADASKLIYPYADGIDLNCGCPQRWAMKDGYGCSLLGKPELIYDMVKSVKRIQPSSFSVSVKIRILKDLNKTIELCRQLEHCGVKFLTVHGRTPSQKSTGIVDTAALREVCQSVNVPIIANGGIRNLEEANSMYDAVGCAGVMSASGMLINPALFSGFNKTPLSCVKLWNEIKNAQKHSINFQCYHHHLVFMLDKILTKPEKVVFNNLNSFENVDEYLYENVLYDFNEEVPCNYKSEEFVSCEFDEEVTLKHANKCRDCSQIMQCCTCTTYDYDATDGAFFTSHVKNLDGLDFMDSNMFLEPT